MIHRTIPKERYILYDTKKEGRRPDTMKMLKDVYVAFKAEGECINSSIGVARASTHMNVTPVVVLITSNPAGNAELMAGCKENDMHAFGPLWDS